MRIDLYQNTRDMQPAVVFGAEKPEWCVMDLPGGRFIVAAEGS